MRALVFHFSSLVGLLVFLSQVWNTAEIEQTVIMAFAVGLVMYTVLMVGFAMAQRIMAATPPADEAAEADGSATAETSTEELTPPNRAAQPIS